MGPVGREHHAGIQLGQEMARLDRSDRTSRFGEAGLSGDSAAGGEFTAAPTRYFAGTIAAAAAAIGLFPTEDGRAFWGVPGLLQHARKGHEKAEPVCYGQD